jgi:hypothetical protein
MVHGLPDRSAVVFDDERVVVNARIVSAVTLGRRLGIEALVDAAVKLGEPQHRVRTRQARRAVHEHGADAPNAGVPHRRLAGLSAHRNSQHR